MKRYLGRSFLLPLLSTNASSFAFASYPRFFNKYSISNAINPSPRSMSSTLNKWRSFSDEEDDSFPLESEQAESLSRKSIPFASLEGKLASLGPEVVLIGEG
jgi:hypothetical protein